MALSDNISLPIVGGFAPLPAQSLIELTARNRRRAMTGWRPRSEPSGASCCASACGCETSAGANRLLSSGNIRGANRAD
jgi:hypothetical protein